MEKASNISDSIRILSNRIEQEINRLSQDTNASVVNRTDSLIYVGNWQDAIPRSIWLDQSLTATDVRCWGIIRTQAVQGSSVMLSLNQLLANTLGYSNATVSRVIYVLRLTRWISLCSQLRSDGGQFRGHIYAIHDNPVSLNDAIYLDENYIDFVKKQIAHSNKQIRELAKTVWQSINDFVKENEAPIPQQSESSVFDFLDNMMSLAGNQSFAHHVQKLNVAADDHVYFLNMAGNDHVQKLNVDEKNIDFFENQEHVNHVQKLNVATTCSSSSYNKTTTTSSEDDQNFENQDQAEEMPSGNGYIFPHDFNRNEKRLAAMYLERVEASLRQSFLDETAGQIVQRRNTTNPIRNPIGFLSWLCNQHANGNTCLTSAHLKHLEQRQRQQELDKAIKSKQDALHDDAMQGGNGTKAKAVLFEEGEKNTSGWVDKPERRWNGLDSSIFPKSIR